MMDEARLAQYAPLIGEVEDAYKAMKVADRRCDRLRLELEAAQRDRDQADYVVSRATRRLEWVISGRDLAEFDQIMLAHDRRPRIAMRDE